MSMDIRNNEERSQYETTVDGHTGAVAYDLEDPDRIVLTHTNVPSEIEGRGVAAAMVKHVLDDARARNLKVVPQCSYVSAFIERHAEYRDLVDT